MPLEAGVGVGVVAKKATCLRQCPTVTEEPRQLRMRLLDLRSRTTRRYKAVPEGARGCQTVPDGARQRVPEGARWWQRVPDGARGCQGVPEGARGCQRVPEGARWCQMVPEGARGCQRGQIGTFVAPALGKASQLIVVKVSIAGVEVDALVDTGATTSCCRWGWYQKWKSHLGSLRKSSMMIVGIGHVPIKVKGLLKPLTLQWDGVGGQCQLMVLTTLTDVDVVLGMDVLSHFDVKIDFKNQVASLVLGMDVLSQFDVKIDFKNQVASPEREPCTPLKPAETVGLLLENPTFTFKGRIPVKEEEVEEVVKGVHRQGHQGEHRIWTASDRKVIKTEGKRKYRRIVRTRPVKSSMPWDQAGYKAQLKKDLEDIRAKLSRILVQEKVIIGGPLFDLCGQRSEEEGGSCDASRPKFLFKYKTSEGKLPSRPMRFKLAYARKARNKDKEGFGPKSCKKAKIYHKKSEDRFWNPYIYLIMCISMIYVYLRKQVNKWQSVEVPSITSGFDEIYEKVEMAPETCQRGRKHNG